MVLLADVGQVFGLAKLDVRAAVGNQTSHGRRVGAALVDRDAGRQVMQVNRALKEAPRRGNVSAGGQQEIHRLAKLVHRAVQVLPLGTLLYGRLPDRNRPSHVLGIEAGLQSYIRPVDAGLSTCWP